MKKSIFKTLTAGFLAVMLLCCAGCQKTVTTYSSYYEDDNTAATEVETNTNSGEESNTNSEAEASKTSSTTGNTSSSSENKKVTTKGKTFTISSPILPTKISSDSTLFERVLFKRIEEVEKEYGCKIKIVNSIPNTMEKLLPLIQANKDFANVIELAVNQMIPLMTSDYLVPYNDIKQININDSKWFKSYTTAATYRGKSYGIQFEKPPEARFCVIMNKTLLQSQGVDPNNIYNLIKQNKWNFSTFRSYAQQAQKVVNGTVTAYGVGGNPSYALRALMAANNANYVSLKGDKYVATYTDQACIDVYDYLNTLVNQDGTYMTTPGMSDKSTFDSAMPNYIEQFIKGKIAFLIEDSWVINQEIKPGVRNFKYGMIQVPMGPNASTYNSEMLHARVFSIPVTNKDRDFTATILNALAENPKGYSGEWYWEDIQADYFQDDDTQSLQIYKDILNNNTVVADMGRGVTQLVQKLNLEAFRNPIFFSNGKTPAAALKSYAGTFDSNINAMFNK